MEAIDPRGNVINAIGVAENTAGEKIVILQDNSQSETLDYIPPFKQICGKNSAGQTVKIIADADRNIFS